MAEGGEPPKATTIHQVCQKVASGLGDEKEIVHCVSVGVRHGRRAHIEDEVSFASHGSPSEEETIAGSSIKIPTNMMMDLAHMTPEEIGHRKRVTPLSHRAEHLISRSDYKGAIVLLEDPCVLDYDFFLPMLMLAECYHYLGKYLKAANVTDMVNKSIVVSLGRKPDVVLSYAKDYLHHSMYIRAIIVVRKASGMYRTIASTHDEALDGIKACLEIAHITTERMMKMDAVSRELGYEIGIECIKKIMRDSKCLLDADPVERELTRAWCCNFIAANLQLVQKDKRSKKYVKRGVHILVKQFGPNKLYYRVYGSLMLHLGNAYVNLGKFEAKGEKSFIKAIQAKNRATDYPNDIEKQKDIESSEAIVKRASERASEQERGST